MEFSFDKQHEPDTANIANERLRKAIERNRQRQREREEKEQKFSPPPPPPPPPFEQQIKAEQEQEAEPIVEPVIERATRTRVARPHDTEFVAVKRTTKKVAPALNYHTTSTRRKSKPLDPVIVSFLTKLAWVFAGFLVLRLIFAQGGVTDFYSQHKVLAEKQSELKKIRDENMQLVREIERMYTDSGYQKKLVRDNLGFIAADEHLILFPKE